MAKQRDTKTTATTGSKVHLMDLTRVYSSIEDLPLYNFNKIETSGDLMWLYEEFDGRQAKIDTENLKMIYELIFNEYFEALEDRSFINKLQKIARKDNLILKHNIVLGLLERINQGFGPSREAQETRAKFLETLKKWGYVIPIINSYKNDVNECNRIFDKLKSVQIQIAIIENELKKDDVGKAVSLQKQMLRIGIALQLPYRINPKTTTVKEWIEMIKDFQELIKHDKDGR